MLFCLRDNVGNTQVMRTMFSRLLPMFFTAWWLGKGFSRDQISSKGKKNLAHPKPRVSAFPTHCWCAPANFGDVLRYDYLRVSLNFAMNKDHTKKMLPWIDQPCPFKSTHFPPILIDLGDLGSLILDVSSLVALQSIILISAWYDVILGDFCSPVDFLRIRI